MIRAHIFLITYFVSDPSHMLRFTELVRVRAETMPSSLGDFKVVQFPQQANLLAVVHPPEKALSMGNKIRVLILQMIEK